MTKLAPQNTLKLIDALHDEIRFARGIEAAILGINAIGSDQDMCGGIAELQQAHIKRLEAIEAMTCAIYENSSTSGTKPESELVQVGNAIMQLLPEERGKLPVGARKALRRRKAAHR